MGVRREFHVSTRPTEYFTEYPKTKPATSSKKWTGLDGAAFAGHSLRRGAISSGVVQGVHIARLKQFSGHAPLKSLEEYVELDELRQHHPLKEVL